MWTHIVSRFCQLISCHWLNSPSCHLYAAAAGGVACRHRLKWPLISCNRITTTKDSTRNYICYTKQHIGLTHPSFSFLYCFENVNEVTYGISRHVLYQLGPHVLQVGRGINPEGQPLTCNANLKEGVDFVLVQVLLCLNS